MSTIRPERPQTPRSLQPGVSAVAAETQDQPEQQRAAGDNLALSSDGTRAAEAGAESLSQTVEAARSAIALHSDLTSRDVTVGAELGGDTSLTARYIYNSPTMMQGAALLKLDYRPYENVTLFAGAGDMPGFYRNEIGTNRSVSTPTSAMFFGVASDDGKHWDLGQGYQLDGKVQIFGVGTLATNSETTGLDKPTMMGLSKATVTSDLTVSRKFGGIDATLGYGHHVDMGMAGTYYVTGGTGLFPQTHFLHGSIQGESGSLSYRADAYLPISSATNDFASTPKLRGELESSSYLANLSMVAGKRGVERIEATKTWYRSGAFEATASVGIDRPFDSDREVMAELQLRYGFDGPTRPRRTSLSSSDYRAEQRPHQHEQPAIPYVQPRLTDFFTPAQIKAMRGKSVEELSKILKTPEQVAAYLSTFVSYDEARAADENGDLGSMTPNEVARLLTGVCRDQHPFVVEVLRQEGIDAKTIGYASPGTSHALAFFQDSKTGKWNALEYGRVYRTEADTPEQAFERLRPDALVSGEWSANGPNGKNYQQSIRYSETAREFYRFVQLGH